jgi:SAF domain-containing protein
MSGPSVGTSYVPETDPAFNGRTSAITQAPIQLPRLPRRRRPGMIALAVALVGAGVLGSAAVYETTNHRVSVLVATATVPAGAVITSGDVGTASVAVGPGVQVIAAGQMQQVIGQVAGSTLHPGMLLTAAEIGTSKPPAPGQALVALGFKPAMLPASGLAPGDRVLIVATPGDQGQPGSSAAPVLTSPVPGVVEAVTLAANPDGYQVVDVLVAAGAGPAVMEQDSTGQIGLIVTRRAP